MPDDEPCIEYGATVGCPICGTCVEHCMTEGGPNACWPHHERQWMGRTLAVEGKATVVQSAPMPKRG
jgi:hypothetical protein